MPEISKKVLSVCRNRSQFGIPEVIHPYRSSLTMIVSSNFISPVTLWMYVLNAHLARTGGIHAQPA